MGFGLCPVCKSKLNGLSGRPHGRDGNAYDCPNCGQFFVTGTALAMLPNITHWEKAGLSHKIWRSQFEKDSFELTSDNVNQIRQDDLPGPDEQLNNLILFLGEQQEKYFAEPFRHVTSHLTAKLGSTNTDAVVYVVKEAARQELITPISMSTVISGIVTFKGWEEYRKRERGQVVSRTAFMAMPFSDATVVRIVDEVFRPAVAETGFTLRRVDDEPRAGLIDDRIRVDIRMSRFLIADLTGGNHGAYWEAGYAEGLDKPVIYTCSRPHFEEHKTHFDTNHCHTVVWDPDNPAKAAELLKATIRATLPFEAKMPEE